MIITTIRYVLKVLISYRYLSKLCTCMWPDLWNCKNCLVQLYDIQIWIYRLTNYSNRMYTCHQNTLIRAVSSTVACICAIMLLIQLKFHWHRLWYVEKVAIAVRRHGYHSIVLKIGRETIWIWPPFYTGRWVSKQIQPL